MDNLEKLEWIESAMESIAGVRVGSAHSRHRVRQLLRAEAATLDPETITVKRLLWIIREAKLKG